MFRLNIQKKANEPKTTLLRVEDKRGKGLYQELWQKAIVEGFKDFCEDEFNALFPEPNEDKDFIGKVKIVRNKRGEYLAMPSYYSAFLNEKQFLQWIHKEEWREKLNQLGGILKFYQVESKYIIAGQKQVLFKKSKAKKIKEESLLLFG